jgi:hypothetical protein
MSPTVGRIVHVNIGGGELRPAIITRTWDDTAPYPVQLTAPYPVQLTVFLDAANDSRHVEFSLQPHIRPGGALLCLSSAPQGDAVGEWRWPAQQNTSGG